MRTVTTTTEVYTYAELSDAAKITARQNVLDGYLMDEEVRYNVAAYLTSQGWLGLDPAEGEQDGDHLSIRLAHSQGDNVAWSSENKWSRNGRLYTVKVEMRTAFSGTYTPMDVTVLDEDDNELDGTELDAVGLITDAQAVVKHDREAAYRVAQDTDLNAADAGGFIEEMIENNSPDYEFLASGQVYSL